MADREIQDAMPPEHWLKWMLVFGLSGILTTVCLQYLVQTYCERDHFRTDHAWMLEQMRELRQGEINCLVDPVPQYIEELLADRASAAAVRDVYLGGDLSNPRFGRLRELPHLKCIVILHGKHHSEFLQRIHGSAAIEQVSFDCTRIVRDDVDQLASFPHLKLLGIGSDTPFGLRQASLNVSDLNALRGHPSLEQLQGAIPDGNGIEALLKSIPHLRNPAVNQDKTKR
jgi:hypothetical protein